MTGTAFTPIASQETPDAKTRTILIPLDASEVTPKVLDWITQTLLDPKRDLLVLFSAYKSAGRELPIAVGFDFDGAVHRLNAEYQKAAESLLAEACRELNAKGIACKAIVQCGDPRQLIEQQIVKNKVDLVVMGKSKRGKVARMFMGSVTNHVIHSAPCPVLLLP